MVTGSILRHFSTIELGTADGKKFTVRNSIVTKLALAFIGIPHLGFRARARIIFRFIKGTPKTARILDAGSGYGIYALTLAERGYSVDAIDLEKERTDALTARKRERPALDERIRTYTGSITELPFQNNSYDLIICSDVIEHIKDDEKAVSELARVLSPEGTLIITVPYHSKNNERIYPMFGHERPGYNIEEMRRILAPHKLSIESVSCYEYALGGFLFKIFNTIHFAPLMAALFYLFYVPYLLDTFIGIGEPNGICFKIRRSTEIRAQTIS
ncbi:MAG: class I SAM-dependent methyltransferase [bacterium]|nr:class I SAM-dependent methyltransferase [bacterium]